MIRNTLFAENKTQFFILSFYFRGIVIIIVSIVYFKILPAFALLIGITVLLLFVALFFAHRFSRYFFTILFSSGWAFVAFMTGYMQEESSVTAAWIFAFYGFVVGFYMATSPATPGKAEPANEINFAGNIKLKIYRNTSYKPCMLAARAFA